MIQSAHKQRPFTLVVESELSEKVAFLKDFDCLEGSAMKSALFDGATPLHNEVHSVGFVSCSEYILVRRDQPSVEAPDYV